MTVSVSATNKEIEKAALSDEHVIKFIADNPVKKIIIVPKKLVNIVI
jgi:leucyl-tRNA synthetase